MTKVDLCLMIIKDGGIMTEEKNGLFHIYTKNTSYVFNTGDTGYPEHIYWGKRLRNVESSLSAMAEKHLKAPVMSTISDRSYSEFSLDDTLLEFSTEGRGDYRVPFLAVSWGDKGDRTVNLKYSSYSIHPGIVRFKGPKMPQAIGSENDTETLEVIYEDTFRRIKLSTFYTAFFSSDIIVRRSVLYNNSDSPLTIRSLASAQIDVRAGEAEITSFSGTWGRERNEYVTEIKSGTFTNSSRTVSSGENDPATIVSTDRDTYLFDLIYSGAHRTTVSVTNHNSLHIVTGINPEMFSWKLDRGEFFETPEAVLIHSREGKDEAARTLRSFITHHIRRGLWKDRMKPVMLNTWDTLGYSPDEGEIMDMAKEAKNLGIEGIVVDDGWFGARDDEKTSLGDWYPDTKHFPSGIKDLANEIHYMGLFFGLWFELEGISERSRLYKAHPDWVVGRTAEYNALGHSQHLLDFSRPDVQEWAVDTLSRIIESANLDYIRWGFSRFQSDIWSSVGDRDTGEWCHRYILGVYRVLDTITKSYPNLYIETASRGGLRLDLGMLSYSASVRMTECSDPLMRLEIQKGSGKLYPLSVLSLPIAGNPDRYTGRSISMETKFNVSAFGIPQYSINPHELGKMEKYALRQQIEFYKAYRPLFQYGEFTVRDEKDRTLWTVYNGDRSVIMMLYYMKRKGINVTAEKLYVDEADENSDYTFIARDHWQSLEERAISPQEMECYTVGGDALKWAGISLSDNVSGNGNEEGMRTLTDNSSRLYIIRKEEKNE